MVLNKEECENALNSLRIFSLQNLNADLRVVTKSNQVIETLIKEHFELVEYVKQLQDEVDKYKHEYYAMCDLIENPQPYKFEELHEEMWVWDEKEKICNLIYETRINCAGEQEIEFQFTMINLDGDEFLNDIFEENRFFPVTKAMQYQGRQVKDDD